MILKRLLTLSAIMLLILTFSTQSNAQVVINEYSVSNLNSFTDNFGGYEDWFELYNTSGTDVPLDGYYLSDNPDQPMKWQFPEGVTIEGNDYLRVWVTGRDLVSGQHIHTSFKLSQTKDTPESIILSNPLGEILDAHQLQLTQKEHSRGRIIDGSVAWGIFTNPTPKNSNNNSTAYVAYAEKPEMDQLAGYYEGAIVVAMSTIEPDSEIRYTTNGADPNASSDEYTDPISVGSTAIVKAIVYSANSEILPSFFDFNTYFIDESHTTAVMSCAAADLDNLLNGNQSLRPFGTFEYFNKEGERTTFGYGEFNEHGQDSWVHDQRSIDYIMRDECGYNYAIREKMIPLTDRDEFQRIILRAAGDDNYPGIDTSALLRDFFVQNTAERNGLHLDVRKGEKGVLYCNGDYWGVYGYREKVNDHDFTDYYYDQGKYDIYYLMLWGGSWAQYGGQDAWDDWNSLHNYIKSNDMADLEHWQYVKSRYDYASLVDYVHINSFVVCSDWINWNVGWWKGTNPDGGHKKWGYVLWDEDATFAHYINYTGVPGINPYVEPCFPEGLTSDPEEHIVALNHLMDSPEFYQYYVSRYVDLYNTAFQPEAMIDYLDTIERKMLPEMPQHVARWGGTVDQWQNNVQKIRNFVTNRHGYLPEGFEDCWGLTGPHEVSFDVQPPGAGTLHVNSLTPDTPWEANYFGGIETKLKVEETNYIYEFDKWVLNNHTVLPNDSALSVTIDFESGDHIVAQFKQRVFNDSLVINEINYNSADNFDPEDWVEFYNPNDYPMDITGWIFKDEDDTHEFIFPENTIIEPMDYLVLSKDTAAFSELFPEVTKVIGDMDFGLSGNGELLRLFNDENILVDTVHYQDSLPWPIEPDGNGPTLELWYPWLDNALAESWRASADHGTPGAMNSVMVAIEENRNGIETASFQLYPNPLTNSSKLRIESSREISNGELVIFNLLGHEVRRISNIQSNELTINRNGLPEGLYVFMFTDNSAEIVGRGKIVVK